MSAIVPFEQGAVLPAYMARRAVLASINADVVHAASFGNLSIKGKVFTLVKGNERKVLTRIIDDEEVPVQSLSLSVVRANTKARVFYAKAYVEGSDEGMGLPDCQSSDGVAPNPDVPDPQAKKCQLCPHAVWGSKPNSDGKGTACTVQTRLAVIDPNKVVGQEHPEAYLLRVPAGSRAGFSDIVKTADARGIPYNALAMRIGFDSLAPSPKLTFKIVGLVSDDVYDGMTAMFESDNVKNMLGFGPARESKALPAPAEKSATEDDLDAALAAKAEAPASAPKPAAKPASAVDMDDLVDAVAPPKPKSAAKAAPKPKPAPVEEDDAPAPKAKPAAKAAPAEDSGGMDNLLGDLDALLSGGTDD